MGGADMFFKKITGMNRMDKALGIRPDNELPDAPPEPEMPDEERIKREKRRKAKEKQSTGRASTLLSGEQSKTLGG